MCDFRNLLIYSTLLVGTCLDSWAWLLQPLQTSVSNLGRDFLVLRNKGTAVLSLSRDKRTMGHTQNLATDRDGNLTCCHGMGFWQFFTFLTFCFLVLGQRDKRTQKKFCPGKKGQQDVPSCFVLGRLGTVPSYWKPYFKLHNWGNTNRGSCSRAWGC